MPAKSASQARQLQVCECGWYAIVRDELREAVAELARPDCDEWITAKACALRWGRRPRFYRDHADEFGGRRVGDGLRPRLEFSAAHVERVLACRLDGRVTAIRWPSMGAAVRARWFTTRMSVHTTTERREALMTPAEVARLASGSLSTVRREIDRGALYPPATSGASSEST